MNTLFGIKKKEYFSVKNIREEASDVKKTEELGEMTCSGCKNEYSKALLKSKLYICPNCGKHLTVSAKERVRQLADKGTFMEQNVNLISGNPLKFPGYRTKLKELKETTGKRDAVITGEGNINGLRAEIVVLDPTFMMGSMGTVVGEKLTLAVEYAMKNSLPLVIVSASGGARMQEGLFSLMQMAKTSAAIEKFSENGGFYISVLTNPTTGGVSASFAMLGDVILAEPDALIGFAGPRVIEQTINEKLPEGFQKSEFQQEHGFVDQVVHRSELKEVIGKLLYLHKRIR